MLNQVFSVQWNHPAKNDWAYMAEQDLVDFEMDTNLSSMKIMSEWAFKNQIRKKAHKYEFDQLMQIKLKHTKLDDLSYDKLEMQNYLKLENIKRTGAQNLSRYQSRMANYGENFCGKIIKCLAHCVKPIWTIKRCVLKIVLCQETTAKYSVILFQVL